MFVIVWLLNLQLPMQSMPIPTNVVSWNPVHGEVYSIQHYVIMFVSELRQVSGFSPDTPVSSTNKTDHNDITEILLKVALNTINQTIRQGEPKCPCLKTYKFYCFYLKLPLNRPLDTKWIGVAKNKLKKFRKSFRPMK